MKNKNVLLGNLLRIGPLLLIMYLSLLGDSLNPENGEMSEFIYDNAHWLALIDILIYSFILMIVPFVWCLINGEKFDVVKGKKICKWNSIILFALSLAITILNSEPFGIGGVGAIIYYFINKWIFVDETKTEIKEKQKEKKTKKKNNKWEINFCAKCYAKVKETDEVCPKCGNVFKDTNQTYENEDINIAENIATNNLKVQGKTRYCKLCGGKLSNEKKCTKCGKQYFHIKSKSTLILIPISILLVISIILNIKFYKENEILSDDNWNLYMENNSLESQLTNIDDGNEYYYVKNKIQFFDDYIVIVPDNSKYYYSYDCYEQKYPTSSFYAYNVSNAEAQGYKKGTC